MRLAILALVLLSASCTPRSLPESSDRDDETPAPVRREPLSGVPAGTVEPVAFQPTPPSAARIAPAQLRYVGAFRLPDGSGGSNWEYSGYAMTYYPLGDPKGPADGYPGSLFAIGHDHHQRVSELAIPAPVLSRQKNLRELPTAVTLQPFRDIRAGRFAELEIPRAGLEYLAADNPAVPGKLHYCWGQHFQFEQAPSHGWCELTLATPRTQGPWRLGDFTNYVTNDYLFEIPRTWSDAHLPGYRLVTGRYRDGRWGGLGPALLAYAPPDEAAPPPVGATIDKVRPLVMYGVPQGDAAELQVNNRHKLAGFSEADEWSGGAWLTQGRRSAVILVGTKATGKSWYGFANGVVYPTSGDPNEPVPPVPPFPYDMRGWWSEDISARILFFDPEDLAAVVRGNKQTWEPQPYATLNLDDFLFESGFDHIRQKRYLLGACCFDRARGRLYVVERRVKQDDEKSVIHVFQLESQPGN